MDFSHPFVLSGSSDKHIRLLDVSTLQGWSTSPSADNKPPVVSELGRGVVCEACGSNAPAGEGSQPPPRRRAHEDLVRSVALGSECVVSGSYDFTVKVRYITKIHPARSVLMLKQVWDRQTGALVADLAGGHTGRIFCVGFDCTKVGVTVSSQPAIIVLTVMFSRSYHVEKTRYGVTFPLSPTLKLTNAVRIAQRICIWDFSHGIDTSFIKL